MHPRFRRDRPGSSTDLCARRNIFRQGGCVRPCQLAHPTWPALSAACVEAARALGITVHDGGTYLAMEAAAFSNPCGNQGCYREVLGLADVIA